MMNKVKTVNYLFMLFFSGMFGVGALAISFMVYSVVCGNLKMGWPICFSIVLFGIFVVAGIIGVIVLLRKYLILKDVIKHGTETVGRFVCVGKTFGWGGSSSGFGPSYHGGRTTWYTRIIFSYTVNDEEHTYTSCAVYRNRQVNKLEELKTFSVKYKGKHAIICEIV